MKIFDKSFMVTRSVLFTPIILIFLIVMCAENGPPQGVIEKAKKRTVAIIDSVRLSRDLVESTPELLQESFDPHLQRYALEYYVETGYGSALTDSPTAYIRKEGERWKYQFQFGGLFESYLEK